MPRISALLIAALLAAVPIAGCGADDVNPDALAQAAEATRQQGGVHMTVTGTVETQGQSIPLSMDGDADLRKLRMRSTIEMGGGLPEIEQVLVGTVMYMRMEGLEEALGAEWVKFDLARIGEQMGVDLGQMMQMSQASPAQQLDYLRTMADLEEVGTETIDGVQTTHYKGEVDLRRYPDVVPAEDREKARRSIEKLIEMSGQPTTPTEVWIDDESLVRRQRMTMTQREPQQMKMEMQIDYTDFGKRVEIEAPKGAKDVTDLAAQAGD
ncbi:MAG TPA: LppX_LprAFG lipoprotein [Solirubrobacteraceae bacterium]|nr:LppX_LprAFG lipoprotein [Solirubrobacteraceae bacterium]